MLKLSRMKSSFDRKCSSICRMNVNSNQISSQARIMLSTKVKTNWTGKCENQRSRLLPLLLLGINAAQQPPANANAAGGQPDTNAAGGQPDANAAGAQPDANANAAGAQPDANANADGNAAGAQQPIQLSPADIERLGREIARELNRLKKSPSFSTIFLLVSAFILLCGVGITAHAIWSAAQSLNRWIDGSCPLNINVLGPNVKGTFWGLIGALLSKIWKHQQDGHY